MGKVWLKDTPGFSLVETMMALVILTFGLLSAGQLLYIAAASGSLARSKDAAAVTAQARLETLATLYRHDPMSPDTGLGSHGPVPAVIRNPETGTVLNRYSVAWEVQQIPDPRPHKQIDARLVRVTVTPSLEGGTPNSSPRLNKILTLSTILSAEER